MSTFTSARINRVRPFDPIRYLASTSTTALAYWIEWTHAIDPCGRKRTHLRVLQGLSRPRGVQEVAGVRGQRILCLRGRAAGAGERGTRLHTSPDLCSSEFTVRRV